MAGTLFQCLRKSIYSTSSTVSNIQFLLRMDTHGLDHIIQHIWKNRTYIAVNMQNGNQTICSWEYAPILFANKPKCIWNISCKISGPTSIFWEHSRTPHGKTSHKHSFKKMQKTVSERLYVGNISPTKGSRWVVNAIKFRHPLGNASGLAAFLLINGVNVLLDCEVQFAFGVQLGNSTYIYNHI